MSNRSKDRSSLFFIFADGAALPAGRHSHLCAFHARKEAQARAGEEAGAFLSGPACGLSPSFPGITR